MSKATKADRMTFEELEEHQRTHWDPDQYPDTRWGNAMKGVCETMCSLSLEEYRSWLSSSGDYGDPGVHSV